MSTERPTVRCLIAKHLGGRWQTRVISVDEAPKYLSDGWLNFARDPFDLDSFRRWEMDERESRMD